MMQFRLPHDLQDDLTWFWCEAEAELGVRSSTGAQLDRCEMRVVSKRAGRDGIRLALATSRRARADEALRQFCIFGPVHDAAAFVVRDPMPDAQAKARDRTMRIHRTLTQLVAGPDGPAHQRILYRVYGPATRHPICYGRVGSELAPLVEYTAIVVDAMAVGRLTAQEAGESILRKASELTVASVRRQAGEMLVASSRAYEALHGADRAQRQQDRRARFRAILGAA